MADGTGQGERGGRLSGLIPLVVVGIIVFLFLRSCFEGGLPFVGSSSDSSNGGSDPVRTETTGPEGLDAPSDTDMARMTRPRDPECPSDAGEAERHLRWTEPPPMCIDPRRDYTATLHTDRGDVIIELDTQDAPTTVNNFVFLARWRFYDTLDFHAVVPGVSIQAGDPTGEPPDVRPPGYTFEGELPDEPDYPPYSVIMGISGEPGVHDSVFAVVTGTDMQLPASFSRLGQITDQASQGVVDEIDATGVRAAAQANSGHDGTPRERTVINSITITER